MTASKNPSAFLASEMASTWQWRLDTDPELAASLGLLSHRRSTHALDPRSLDSFAKRLEWIERSLRRIQDGLTPQDVSGLSSDEKLSHRLYVTQLQDYVKYTREHKTYLCCVNRMEGPQTDLPLYARYLPLKKRSEREFYRDFLKAVPVQIREVIELLTAGLAEGRTQARVSMDGVVAQIKQMVEGKMQSFTKPILGNDSKDISGCFDLPEENELQDECIALMYGAGGVSDAFTEFAAFLESHYIPNLRQDISAVTGYPNGQQYYADCLAFHTTTTMTPKEVHQLGLAEVERMRKSMNEIAAQAGYESRLEDYMGMLRTSAEFEPESSQALCARYRDITGRTAPELLKLFHLKTLPRLPFTIVETPAANASMAPAAYYLAGSADPGSSRPGTFYVNTSELPTRRTYECEALALHEAIPGHHTQGAIQGENESLPDFRRYAEDRRYFEAPCRFPFYTAYIEGWGLHCETLGEELGLYQNPSEKMGQLSMEALRACRLVVDTGMHALGWSLDKAHQYMLENTAMGNHDARTEVIRYVTWPGQATAYKVGERCIHRLRRKAEAKLDVRFDPRDFYHLVLTAGPVPLDVLESLVDEYIAEELLSYAAARGGEKIDDSKSLPIQAVPADKEFIESMTFANWCKCCIVPGTCASYLVD